MGLVLEVFGGEARFGFLSEFCGVRKIEFRKFWGFDVAFLNFEDVFSFEN